MSPRLPHSWPQSLSQRPKSAATKTGELAQRMRKKESLKVLRKGEGFAKGFAEGLQDDVNTFHHQYEHLYKHV